MYWSPESSSSTLDWQSHRLQSDRRHFFVKSGQNLGRVEIQNLEFDESASTKKFPEDFRNFADFEIRLEIQNRVNVIFVVNSQKLNKKINYLVKLKLSKE